MAPELFEAFGRSLFEVLRERFPCLDWFQCSGFDRWYGSSSSVHLSFGMWDDGVCRLRTTFWATPLAPKLFVIRWGDPDFEVKLVQEVEKTLERT